MIDLVRAMTNPGDERITYDLRFTSLPNPDRHTAGRVEVTLFTTYAEDLPSEEAARHASIMGLKVQADFEEYDFVSDGVFGRPAVPAPFTSTHFARIRRRAIWVLPDTLKPPTRRNREGIGFRPLARSASTHVPLPRSN